MSTLPWSQLLDHLALEGATKQLARQCSWISREGEVIHLGLAPDASFLNQESRRAALELALRRTLNEPVVLRIDVALPAAGAESLSPAQQDAQRNVEKIRGAVESIETDPVVRAFKDQFGAVVRPNSIQPLDS